MLTGVDLRILASGGRRAVSGSLLRNEHHAEPRFALHHASVTIGSLFERDCLDHRTDILQDTEGERVLVIDRRAGQAPIDRAPAKDEQNGRVNLEARKPGITGTNGRSFPGLVVSRFSFESALFSFYLAGCSLCIMATANSGSYEARNDEHKSSLLSWSPGFQIQFQIRLVLFLPRRLKSPLRRSRRLSFYCWMTWLFLVLVVLWRFLEEPPDKYVPFICVCDSKFLHRTKKFSGKFVTSGV